VIHHSATTARHPLPLHDALPISEGAAHAAAFVIALAVVTFLHMVVGEMAPKSWAITDPERSATPLGLPFRAFTTVARPVLAGLNGSTNLPLRMIGGRRGGAQEVARPPEQLRSIAEDARRLGLTADTARTLLRTALAAPPPPLADLVAPVSEIGSVPPSATPQEVIDTAARTGRLRITLRGSGAGAARMVHVRDAYLARARGLGTTAGELAHPVPAIPAATPAGD